MSIKNRTIEFINSKHISVKQFEEKCSLSNGYVSSMRKGYGIVKLENVLTVYPELNREWLLYGEGGMIKDLNDKTDNEARKDDTESNSYLVNELLAALKRRDDNMAELIKTNDKHADNTAELLKQMKKTPVPLEGNAADADVS